MFEKFDKKFARGCLIAFLACVLLCAVGGFSSWHYLYIDEPMVLAAKHCDYDVVKRYLDIGADPNTRFDSMDSALEASQRCKDDRITKLLISRGATE